MDKIDFNNMSQEDLEFGCSLIRDEFNKSLAESGLSKAMFVASHPDRKQITLLIVTFQDAAKAPGLEMPEVIEGLSVECNDGE